MSEKCPICDPKIPGLCIHEKIMLGTLGVVVVVVVVLIIFF